MRNRDLRESVDELARTRKYIYQYCNGLDMFNKSTDIKDIKKYVVKQCPKLQLVGSEIICKENKVKVEFNLKKHDKIKDKVYIDTFTLISPSSKNSLTIKMSPSISIGDMKKYNL